MSELDNNVDRLLNLAEAACDKIASTDELTTLDSILLNDPTSRRCYLDFCWMHVTLGLEMRAHEAAQQVRQRINIELGVSAPSDSAVTRANTPSTTFVTFFSTAYRNTFTHLSSGWPVAYLIATVVYAIAAFIGSLIYVSKPADIANTSVPDPVRQCVSPEFQEKVVGRITGAVNCHWTASSEAYQRRATVTKGEKLSLRSGLVEITYGSGAKVLLEGPVTYRIDSENGGFLQTGKLTGKVTTESARGLSVRTPTAVITDLGTEFGVEVDGDGQTVSHVFRGSIQVRAMTNDKNSHSSPRVLHENDSIRVDRQGIISLINSSKKPITFVRDIPESTVKIFDLVDVVAGGNGYTARRGPSLGLELLTNYHLKPEESPKPKEPWRIWGDYKYHRVNDMPFIDGVFIPDGSRGPVQVDSAGHKSDCFLQTANNSSGDFQTGGIIPTGDPNVKIRTEMGGIDYGKSGHGVLSVFPNRGITFDLGAIRRANPDHKIVRFRAVVGNTETLTEQGYGFRADVWVLIDGRTTFRRQGINRNSDPSRVDTPIRDEDDFLTLAATDSGDDIYGDWIIFGDPRLELSPKNVGSAQNHVDR